MICKYVIKTTIVSAGILLLFSCQRQNYIEPDTKFLNMKTLQPEFSINSVSDDFDVLVLNFFAPGCPPCINEIPELKLFHKMTLDRKNDQKNILFVSIGSSLSELNVENTVEQIQENVSQFVQSNNLPYPVYLADRKLLKNFRITGYPETFIFFKKENKEWSVIRKYLSEVNSKDLMDKIIEFRKKKSNSYP